MLDLLQGQGIVTMTTSTVTMHTGLTFCFSGEENRLPEGKIISFCQCSRSSGGTPQLSPRPHLCTLLDISMGRPMFLDSRLKLGSKYSSAEMAVGLVVLAACCTGA